MKTSIAVVILCAAIAGEANAYSVPQPSPYFTAISPIFGYDPAYGALVGLAWFSYPSGDVADATTRRDLNLVMRFGPHGAINYQQRSPKVLGDWGWDYGMSANNFYRYTTADDSNDIISEQDQLTLSAYTKVRKQIDTVNEWYAGPAAHWQTQFNGQDNLNSHVVIGLSHDRRDHPINAHQGYRLNAEVKYQAPAMNNQLDEHSAQITLDGRFFIPFGAQQTLALHGIAQASIQDGFRSEIGGSELLRGYLADQLTGNRLLAGQIEYRFPVWRFIRGVSFIDAAYLGQHEQMSGYQSAGLGLRFGLPPDQSMSVRWDVAVNDNGQWLSYVNFNHVF